MRSLVNKQRLSLAGEEQMSSDKTKKAIGRKAAWDIFTGIEDDFLASMMRGKLPDPKSLKQAVATTRPRLQPRLTGFHGTPVPVVVLFFLRPCEVGRMLGCD